MHLKKERCNILVIGLLSSGSSGVNALLKEYENIGYFSIEFDDFRAPGLVADQLSYPSCVNFPNKIDELVKFSNLTKILLFKSLIWKIFYNCVPKKYWGIDWNQDILNRFKFKLLRLNQLYLLQQLNKHLKTNIAFDEKIQISNKWIQQIGNIFPSDKDYILFDQPLMTSLDADIWTTVFKPFKMIIVYRDPRDQLADIIHRGYLFSPYGSPAMTMAGVNITAIYGRGKKGGIKFHLDAIRNRLKWIESLEKRLGPDQLLLIDYEGLVNKYDDYKSIIEHFIGGISDKHSHKNKYFNPVVSKNNIGIYKKYLGEDDLKDLSDLREWYFQRIGHQKTYAGINVV